MTRLSIITRSALVGLALLGGACQGELMLRNAGSQVFDLSQAGPDMAEPVKEDEISFRQINRDLEEPTFGCTSALPACHGGEMPVGKMKLAPNGLRDATVLAANHAQVEARVDKMNPPESLFITKVLATRADVMHIGGKTYLKNEMDPVYKRWVTWVRCGAKLDPVKLADCPMGGGM